MLLTGHTGYKGAWLALWLLHAGAKVVGYSLEPPSRPNLYEALGLERSIESQIADVRDADELWTTVERTRPTVVFHLAAQSLVRDGYANPVETYATNVMGTVNLLDAVRRVDSCRATVVVTSDKCYENDPPVPHTEGDALGGSDPYSNSKACAELAVRCFARSFFDGGTLLASVRAGNVIGGGDWARDRIVPDVIRATYEGDGLRLRHPSATRPWQHVFEPLSGYVELAERGLRGETDLSGPWNFGPPPERELPVRDLVEALLRRLDSKAEIQIDDAAGPPEAAALALDSTKARERLGWVTRLDMPQTIEYTAAWYRSYYEREDVLQTSLAQLASFVA